MSKSLRNVIILAVAAAVAGVFCLTVWYLGSSNCQTPAGYVGYLTQKGVFAKSDFAGVQKGPTSSGRTWMLDVVNVSITPYKFTETFGEHDGILSQDQLMLTATVHVVFRIDQDKVKDFVEKYSTLHEGTDPNKVVEVAYDNFLQPRLRSYIRDQLQQHPWKDDVAMMMKVGEGLDVEMKAVAKDSPFIVDSVVIDSIQPPKQVADAVTQKLATDQELARKDAEVAITKKDAEKREAEAVGIASAMQTINGKLTPMYLQHEAIEAQKQMINSPNHTVIYIPSGHNGVPVVGTFSTKGE